MNLKQFEKNLFETGQNIVTMVEEKQTFTKDVSYYSGLGKKMK